MRTLDISIFIFSSHTKWHLSFFFFTALAHQQQWNFPGCWSKFHIAKWRRVEDRNPIEWISAGMKLDMQNTVIVSSVRTLLQCLPFWPPANWLSAEWSQNKTHWNYCIQWVDNDPKTNGNHLRSVNFVKWEQTNIKTCIVHIVIHCCKWVSTLSSSSSSVGVSSNFRVK